MSYPRFHHYVPRFYLSRFVDENGRLWVFDKYARRIFPTTPENIAGENRFYYFDDLEAIGQDPLLMERQFADLESEARNIR